VAGDSFEASIRTEDGNAGTTETLTNTGTIATSGTVGAPRIAGDLINQGTITSAHPQVRFESETESRLPKLTNAAGASFTVAAGSQFSLVPGEASFFENAGTVQLNGILAPGNVGYTQTAGMTTLAAPANSIGLSPGGVVNVQGGVLRGTGSITGGDVNNTGGTLAPGESPGSLTLTDDYVQGPGGNLAIEVSGPNAGIEHDQLVVGGTASLAGALTVDTAGFVPDTGQQFKVIDAPAPPASPTVSGSFATQVENGRDYDVAVNATDVTLTALAPPGSPDPPQVSPDPPQPPESTPDAPAVDGSACERARDKLAKAKKKLRKLKRNDASPRAVKKAKRKVKKAKGAVAEACA
jgi:hypothetical protein